MSQNPPANERRMHRALWAVVALLALIAIELSNGLPAILPSALAQIPDTALQRKQLIDEARRTNELLARILAHLEQKSVKVQLAAPDKADSGRAPAGRR